MSSIDSQRFYKLTKTDCRAKVKCAYISVCQGAEDALTLQLNAPLIRQNLVAL